MIASSTIPLDRFDNIVNAFDAAHLDLLRRELMVAPANPIHRGEEEKRL